MSRLIDLTGKRFGRLTVIKRAKNRGHHVMWLCLCDCGTEKTTYSTNLKKGVTKSCGCLNSELSSTRNRKHGNMSGGKPSPEYKTWTEMTSRCSNPKNKSYVNYGGRGISVCDRWKHNFDNFLKDMGERPSPKHSIDRIDVNGNYEPSNCKWSTPLEQAHNRRRFKTNSTGVAGVTFNKDMGKYHARITNKGKSVHLGFFDTLKKASEAREKAELKYWGKSS